MATRAPAGGLPKRWLRLPARTVRLRLTLLYGGLFFVSGAVLLGITYLIFRHASGVNLIVPSGSTPGNAAQNAATDLRVTELTRRSNDALDRNLLQAVLVLALMTAASIALGWVIAGRVLHPLRVMTARTRKISERNLEERLALTGPQDELKDLSDTIDGLLARLEAHVAEQQRFAANASHELRTPLALTQTLLDVARNDPSKDKAALVERLSAVNTRAIDLTEALLLLSRAEKRAFSREPVDLSLLGEEAAETLLPLAEKHGVEIETSGEASTSGSRALLLQLIMNLVHNAIVHNRPDGGSVWVRAGTGPSGATLVVENTGQSLSLEQALTLVEPFLRGEERARSDHAGVGLGLAIAKSIAEAHDGGLDLAPRDGGGLRVTVLLPGATRT
jgi:two-component system, OmpR family, sensor histidine kinase VanS